MRLGSLALIAVMASLESPAFGQSSAELSALRQQIEALQGQVKKLEDRLDQPMIVKAPFLVVDNKGAPVMKVTRGEFSLGDGDRPPVRVTQDGDGVRLELSNAATQVQLVARQDNTAIVSASAGPGKYTRLITNGSSSASEAAQGADVAQLGSMAGSGRVKLWKGDKPFFVAASTAQPLITLGDVAKPLFSATEADGGAQVKLLKGESAVEINANASGTGLSASIGADDVTLGVDAGARPHLRLTDGGSLSVLLGSDEESLPGLYIMDNDALAASIGHSEDGPTVGLWDGENLLTRMGRNKDREGFVQIAGANGRVSAELGRTADRGKPGLRVYDDEGALVLAAGRDANDIASYRLISKGNMAVDISAAEGAGRLAAFAAGGQQESAVIQVRGGVGVLELSKADGKVAAAIGPDAPNDSLGFRLYAGGKVLAGMTISQSGSGVVHVRNKSGAIAGLMGAGAGGGHVSVFKGDGLALAGMNVGNDGKGYLHVYNASGEIMSTLAQGVNGGLLQLNNQAGVVMVEAGNTGSVGIVQAGPVVRPGSGMLGMPGSYIKGRLQ